MITVRMVDPSEMESAKKLIRKVFPDAMVHVNDEDTIIMAELNEKPVGFAHIIKEEDRVILRGLGVDGSMRGQGIGTLLLEHILDMFSEGHMPIYLKVKVMNPAIELYSRYGFFLQKFGNSHVLVKKTNS